MSIGVVIKEKRKKQAMTQEQLAEKISVSSKTISNWETGKTTPDIDMLIRLAHFLHFSLDHVLLEGSQVVKNIKIQSEIKTTRFFCLLTSINNMIFALIYLFPHTFGSPNFALLMALFSCNFLSLMASLYFSNKLENLQNRQNEQEKIADRKNRRIYNVLGFLFGYLFLVGILMKALYDFLFRHADVIFAMLQNILPT